MNSLDLCNRVLNHSKEYGLEYVHVTDNGKEFIDRFIKGRKEPSVNHKFDVEYAVFNFSQHIDFYDLKILTFNYEKIISLKIIILEK